MIGNYENVEHGGRLYVVPKIHANRIRMLCRERRENEIKRINKRKIFGVALITAAITVGGFSALNSVIDNYRKNKEYSEYWEYYSVKSIPPIRIYKDLTVSVDKDDTNDFATPSNLENSSNKKEWTNNYVVDKIVDGISPSLIHYLSDSIHDIKNVNLTDLIGELKSEKGTSEYEQEVVEKVLDYLYKGYNNVERTRSWFPYANYLQAVCETYSKYFLMEAWNKSGKPNVDISDVAFYFKNNDDISVNGFEVNITSDGETTLFGRWLADDYVSSKLALPSDINAVIASSISLKKGTRLTNIADSNQHLIQAASKARTNLFSSLNKYIEIGKEGEFDK